jgi:thiol-disulfide isomerase/thioredoxin
MKKQILFPVFLLASAILFAMPAPDFTITTSDGQQRKLYQDYIHQQKLVVLEIFFTNCPPCSAHAPHVQALYQTLQSEYPNQLEFILLSDKNYDNNTAVAAYLSGKNLTMPGAGADGGSLAAVQPYKSGSFGLFLGTPTFIVIAPETGEVFFDIRGNSPQETMTLLEAKIGELLPQDCFLQSYFNNPVPDVQISVDAPAFDTTFTASGAYNLANIPALANSAYSIAPFKGGDPLQGVSTFDMLLIAKHILNLTPLTQPWQLLAADLNCSGSVTSLDIVEGRKLILGINNSLNACGGAAWRFVADPPGMPEHGSCLNFRGVKIGDINGPYFASDPDDREAARLYCHNRRLQAGQTYLIPMFADMDMRINGIQLGFGTSPARMRIRKIESPVLQGFDGENYTLQHERSQGYIPLSWNANASPAGTTTGQPLLILEIEVLQSGLLCDMLGLRQQLKAEIYTEDGDNMPFALDMRSPENAQNEPLFLLAPNPAKETVVVYFISKQTSEVLFRIADLQGRTVFESNVATIEGQNGVELRPNVPLSGLYVVTIDGKTAGKVFFE